MALDHMGGEAEQNAAAAKGNRLSRFAPLGVILAGLALGYAFGLHEFLSLSYLAESRESLLARVNENRSLALFAFTALYATATAFSFPAASILTIFGGFLFGWLPSALAVAIGATLGATAIFLVAKSSFGKTLREKVGGRVKQLAEGFEKDAFSYLLILRLAPVFPFFVVNIAPALFNVSLRTYVITTFIGILPGVFVYTYLGSGIGNALESAAAAGAEVSLGDIVTPQIQLAFLALATIAAMPLIVKKIRQRRIVSAAGEQEK